MIPRLLFQTSRTAPEPYGLAELSPYLTPGWRYRHFTDEQILSFFAQNREAEFPDIAERFLRMPTGPTKSDLFRYYFLYCQGGVFIDSDAIPKAPLDRIIEGVDFFTARSGYIKRTVFQGFIGCTPRHPVIYRALKDAYEIDLDRLKNYVYWLCANLYEFIEQYPFAGKLRLFEEVGFDNGVCEILDENDNIVLVHYLASKRPPKTIWDTRSQAAAAPAASEPEAVLAQVFALARAGRLPGDLYAQVFEKIRQSGNQPLLQAFAELRAA